VVGKSKALVIFVAAPLLIAAGFLIFLLTTRVVGGGGQDPAASTTTRPRPTVTETARDKTTTQTTTEPIACGTAVTTDVGGEPIGVAELVRGIHDAACRGVYSELLPFMDDSFGGFPKAEVVDGWMTQDPDGDMLATLAQSLETPALADQGGNYYCHPNGAVVVFSRGTYDRPGGWGDFDPSGRRLPMCEGAG
jgi:hypothetical protein